MTAKSLNAIAGKKIVKIVHERGNNGSSHLVFYGYGARRLFLVGPDDLFDGDGNYFHLETIEDAR